MGNRRHSSTVEEETPNVAKHTLQQGSSRLLALTSWDPSESTITRFLQFTKISWRLVRKEKGLVLDQEPGKAAESRCYTNIMSAEPKQHSQAEGLALKGTLYFLFPLHNGIQIFLLQLLLFFFQTGSNVNRAPPQLPAKNNIYVFEWQNKLFLNINWCLVRLQRTAKENTSQLTAFLPSSIIIPQQYFEFKPTQHGT